MSPIDWPALLSSAPQLVTAVVFGFFVIKLLERQDKQNDKRDDEWRSFLTTARTQYTSSVSSVAGEIRTLAEVVGKTYQLLSDHDTRQQGEIARNTEERSLTIAAAADAVKVAAQAAAEAVKAAAVVAESARVAAQVAAQVTAQVTAQMAAAALLKVEESRKG